MNWITAYRIVGATLAWAALTAKYFLGVASGEHSSTAIATIDYFGKFTHLTNILVALALTAAILAPKNAVRKFFEQAPVRAALALYILVVAVVYYLLLAGIKDHQGWEVVTNVSLHIVVPVIYLFDWLMFSRKHLMTYAHIPYWLIYPMSYTIFSITKGAILRMYPYPFLDVDALGYGLVGLNILAFGAVFAAGAALFIFIGQILAQTEETESTQSSR